MRKDPTLVLDGDNDDANGETPNPPRRYGKELPPEWIPLYRKPLRTPTRKRRIACIGGGISAMNLAYKIYHEFKDITEYTELCIYEKNDHLGGTWAVNTCTIAAPVHSRRAYLLEHHCTL